MTDELDVLTRLRDYHDHIAAATVPVADDVRRGRRRVVRRRRFAAGGVALAIAGLVATASLVTRSDSDSAPEPAPRPKEENTAIVPVLRNGQITSADRYLGAEASGYAWRSFDRVSENGLFLTGGDEDSGFDLEGLTVVGPTGPVATLSCARDLPCSPKETWWGYAATLGPKAHEVTVVSGDGTAQVIGYDGTLRRTVDLTATIAGSGEVRGLRWSPDGGRLAVVTYQYLGREGTHVTRLWLVDREGGDAQLAYSLWLYGIEPLTQDGSDFDGDGEIWTDSDWGWSPDGQTLLLDVRNVGSYGADVVLLHMQPDGAADPVIAQKLYHSTRNFDWWGNVAWSPDGTRIAVRTMVAGTDRYRIVEISADDGSVIAQHPHDNGWLIWPAREGE